MNLPDGCHLAYAISGDAWYAPALSDEPPTVTISAATPTDGIAWEFQVVKHDLGDGTRALRVEVFAEAWPAFAQVPEVFAALAAEFPPVLGDVVIILDRLGAVDETARTNPYATGGTT